MIVSFAETGIEWSFSFSRLLKTFLSTKQEENGIARIEGPIVRMIVPGHTTKVNFSNAFLYDLGSFQNFNGHIT